ncbi:MAG: hypothetical protein BWX88_04758 [Planctomycetes bacterium ADurb.Bin126]|nr:MAG: hypothetical protein BWX88_04758 [Planctomycetes bacterium ADurb.Bin126]
MGPRHLAQSARVVEVTTAFLLALSFPVSAAPSASPANAPPVGSDQWWQDPSNVLSTRADAAAMHVAYLERMSQSHRLTVRKGAEFQAHQKALRRTFLACAGLWPLPDRLPLDLRHSEPLDHEWCTIRRVAYQLWPEVYATGLLYMPKSLPEQPAPAVLCPHGHWPDGNAHPVVQSRCLALAKMGYVVFSTTQNHYEDLPWGVSHQTVMIWSNIRGLDLLESLAEVDKTRIGCTGCSGGGLQTEMLLAAEGEQSRIRAASVVGMTCDFREIIFPASHHCVCNHFPNIMRCADPPELATLAMPAAVQFLTMNDWTQRFEKDNFPLLVELYKANGLVERLDCHYEPTEHTFDKSKRERMYGWMEKWLRGKEFKPVSEPEIKTFPVKTLQNLKADDGGNKGFSQISGLFAKQFAPSVPKLASRAEWDSWRKGKLGALDDLLGRPLGREGDATRTVASETRDGLVIEKVLVASEGPVKVPVLVLRSAKAKIKLPVVVYADSRGKAAMLADKGAESPAVVARSGSTVVLADVRFAGEMRLEAISGLANKLSTFKPASNVGERPAGQIPLSWERNSIFWGRPAAGMGATDLRAVIDYACGRDDVEVSSVQLVGCGDLAAVAMFAAAGEPRAKSLRLDFGGKCYQARTLPLVPFILRHGDVATWLAVLADRRVEVAGLSGQAGSAEWLKAVFRAAGNADGLRVK